jgi:hypothetical protein
MKKYFIIVIITFFTLCLSSNELSWVDTQVEAIKPPRKGMNNSQINSIKSPFMFLNDKKNKRVYTKTKSFLSNKKIKTTQASSNNNNIALQKPTKPLVLSAIINNSALINGQWYKVNDYIDNFKLSIVNRTSVVLSRGATKLVLSTSEINRNLKFK